MSAPLLAHLVEGQGEKLVLLNGGMMSYPSWEPIAALLRERYQVLRCDFRGQLLSPLAPEAPALPGLLGDAADVAALLDSLGWEEAHFVGTSFGAEVALEMAAHEPRRFRSLVAITAMDTATEEFQRQNKHLQAVVRDILQGGSREPFWQALLDEVYSDDYLRREREVMDARAAKLGLLPASYFEGIGRVLRAVDGFDLAPRLYRFPFPSLVVIAAEDRVMLPERSHALAEAIGAEVVVNASAGHGLVAEEPLWVADICRDFLGRLGAPSPDVVESVPPAAEQR